jgi:hypothetical protein
VRVICVVTILLMGMSHASPEELPVRVFGEGTITCGQWLHYRTTTGITGAEAEAWARGFLSGMNAGDPLMHSVGHGVQPEGNNVWIDNYCRQHPLEMLYDAALALRAALWNAGRR